MAWPPPIPPNRSDLEPQLGDHPADHNKIADALTELTLIDEGDLSLDVAFGGLATWSRYGLMVVCQFVGAGQGGRAIGIVPPSIRPAANWVVGSWWAYNSSGTGTGVGGSMRLSAAAGVLFQDGGGTVPAGGTARGSICYMIGQSPPY